MNYDKNISAFSFKWLTQKILYFGVVFLFFVCNTQDVFAREYSVHSLDSIAGYGTEITVKNAQENEEISLIVRSPVKEIFTFDTEANDSGIAHITIPKEDTYEAGEYTFVVVPKGFSFEDGEEYSFEIFADDPSPSISKIKTENVSLSTGEKGVVRVFLQDQYGNKIQNHRVQLISSRSEDTIEYLSGNRTNKNGIISFEISSQEEGNSRLSALDETSNIALKDRKNILFYDNTPNKSSSSSLFSANMFGEGGDDEGENTSNVSGFKIEFPSTIEVNSNENSLTITAIDANGDTVKDFIGTIIIKTPNDPNSDIPGEDGKYRFLKKDQGTFTFSRSLSFSTEGEQVIEVFLYNEKTKDVNTNIFGKKNVFVKQKGTYASTVSNNEIKILNPENNSKFSTSNISITGRSKKNSDVQIFLDDSPYKTVSVGENGEFNLSLHDVEEGKHSIYAQHGVDEDKIQSKKIYFFVDSHSPELKTFHFSKTSVEPEEEIDLSVETKGNANTVEVFLNDESYEMKQKNENTWILTFSAPKEPGEYSVRISVTDEYQNTSKETLHKKIIVHPLSSTKKDILSGFFSEKKNSIILEWEKPAGETPILYILHTGDSPNTLKQTNKISGRTTKMEYKNFDEGEKIFFAISPVDIEGKEGKMSNIIAVQTKKKQNTIPPKVEPITVIKKDPQFTIQSIEKKLLVRWEPTENTDHYDILYGMDSGEYLKKVKKTSFKNTDSLIDLIPGKKYYVRIQAKDSFDNVVFDYGEKAVIIKKNSFHFAPRTFIQTYPQFVTQTGPQLFIFLGALFFITSGIILWRKE